MSFEEIIKEIKTAIFDEVRIDEIDYFEGVILKNNLEMLNLKLEAIFGPAALPSQNKLSREARTLINNFGGIMPGQTLYLKAVGDAFIFVMFWPWSDGQHITVKCGRK